MFLLGLQLRNRTYFMMKISAFLSIIIGNTHRLKSPVEALEYDAGQSVLHSSETEVQQPVSDQPHLSLSWNPQM